MKKPLLASALAVALLTTSGCAVIMRFIGDMTANAITQKTGNLSELAVRVSYTSNLYPKASAMIETESTEWADGQNMLQVALLKRSGVGMYELDGGVGYQAKPGGPIMPMTYVGKGAYQVSLPAKDLGAKTIVLRAANGQTASYKVAPAKPITIKAINGKPAKNAVVDLSKDLVLDLANPPGTVGSTLKVSVAAQAMGLKSMTAIGHFKAADRLVIPKEAFRNMVLSASQDVGLVGIEKGASYLVVERYDAGYPASAAGAAEVLGQAWSWAPVTVTGDAPLNASLSTHGSVPGTTSPLNYVITKPNAFYGPPIAQAHTVALGGLRVRGKLYERNSTSNTTENRLMGTVTTVTTTTIKRFPEVPDSHWNALMQELETQLTAALRRSAGTSLVGPERLTGAPTYQAMKEITEAVDRHDTTESGAVTASVTKVRPGSRYIVPEGFDTLQVSSTFPADRPISRLIRESRVDGLFSTTLDLQIAADKDNHLVLVPRLTWSLYGPVNGYMGGPTSYGYGIVESADGVPFNADKLQHDPAEMIRVARIDELVTAFEASLKDLRAKEQAAGYEAIWKLH